MANRFLLCKSSITCTISATTDIILTAALSTPCRAGKPETSPYIVRNETNGSYAIEQFLARIILGNSYGAWDKLNVAKGETVATDSSLYAAVLKYLGTSNLAIQNYLDAYYGKLSITQNGSTLIPNIIWSWVGAETLGGTNRIYTIGDVAANGSSNTSWLKTAYTSSANCNTGFGTRSWMRNSTDTMICKLMLGGNLSHGQDVWLDCTELYPPPSGRIISVYFPLQTGNETGYLRNRVGYPRRISMPHREGKQIPRSGKKPALPWDVHQRNSSSLLW